MTIYELKKEPKCEKEALVVIKLQIIVSLSLLCGDSERGLFIIYLSSPKLYWFQFTLTYG